MLSKEVHDKEVTLTNQKIQEKLTEKFGSAVYNFEEPYGMLTFSSDKQNNLKVLQFLYDDADLQFQFLTDLQAVHYPLSTGKELAVVYHLHNLRDNVRIRYKVFTDKNDTNVFSATKLFSAANWMERETYDFFGINFIGHPNLKRILNVDEMDYFPLLKQYPVEDQSRTDKDDDMFGRGKNRETLGDMVMNDINSYTTPTKDDTMGENKTNTNHQSSDNHSTDSSSKASK